MYKVNLLVVNEETKSSFCNCVSLLYRAWRSPRIVILDILVKSLKKISLLSIKLTITALFIYFIIVKTDWHALADVLFKASVPWVIAAFCIMLLCVPYSAFKWQKILEIHHQPFDLKKLTSWYFIAMFFNNFLPTGVGGDAYRIWKTIEKSCPRGISLLAVLSERISGIIVLLGLGFISAWISWLSGNHALGRLIAVSGTCGLAAAAVLALVIWHFDLFKKYEFKKVLPHKLQAFFSHGKDYIQQPIASLTALGVLSIIFHILSIVWMLFLMKAVGASIEIWNLTLVAALIAVVTVLPISINGIGVVDASFIWLVGQFGVPFEAGLGYMILLRFLLIPISAVGAIIYMKTNSTGQKFPT